MFDAGTLEYGDSSFLRKIKCEGSLVHDIAPFDILCDPIIRRGRCRDNAIAGIDSEHSILEIIIDTDDLDDNNEIIPKICLGKVAAIIQRMTKINDFNLILPLLRTRSPLSSTP